MCTESEYVFIFMPSKPGTKYWDHAGGKALPSSLADGFGWPSTFSLGLLRKKIGAKQMFVIYPFPVYI